MSVIPFLFAAASAVAVEFMPVPIDGTPKGEVGADGSVSFAIPPMTSPERRKFDFVRFDAPVDLDLRDADGVTFEAKVADLWSFASMNVFFAGEGWKSSWHVPFEVPRAKEWVRVAVRKDRVDGYGGDPADWSGIRTIRLYLNTKPGIVTDTSFAVRNFRVIPANRSAADVWVVLGDRTMPVRKITGSYFLDLARRTAAAFQRAGCSVRLVCESDLSEIPAGTKVVALPYNTAIPDGAKRAVEGHLARGGFLYLSGNQERSWLGPLLKRYAGRFHDAGFGWVRDGTASLAAHLSDVLAKGCPDLAAAAKACVAARGKEQAGRVAALGARRPGKPGERRFMDCHTAWGGIHGTRDWDESIRRLAEGGITDVIVDFAWGATAYYDSKVLTVHPDVAVRGDPLVKCLAACRRRGVKLHAWRCCWTSRSDLSADVRTRFEKEGRFQRGPDGNILKSWLCPSHPENHRMHVEAMVELAKKGVDGIHYDFIRYGVGPTGGCFCDHCRAAFEKDLGRAVANWPQDVIGDPSLKKEWGEFRCRTISRGIEEISRRVRAECPGVEISSSGGGDGTNYRIPLARDWLRWAREGWIDFVSLMDYDHGLERFTETVVRQAAVKTGKCRVYPGLGPSCWPVEFDAVKDAERMADQIEAVRRLGFGGFGVFEYDERADGYLPLLRKGALAPTGR